jgi:ATP-dependent helicase YprA (DUF1998 family)
VIPSLVAGELRTSIVEYLATTFALSDDATYAALTDFLLDADDGIFRGPFLRVRLPFVDAPGDADHGLRWTPPGFRPYAHQVAAWARLAGRDVTPKPTLITTGTGSGKSEGFLIPVIDHCISRRESGERGIKALLLYPMNALVTDQERRIARMLTDPAAVAAGVRAGVWIGDDQTASTRRDMSPTHLVSDPSALMDDPPDILLTNYKMLDRLLTTPRRRRLWAANTPPSPRAGWEQPLTYLVLDEFHTYDGAQGTDVAMLLRRLGHRLRVATPQSPLTGVAPIGTSATLGSSPTSAADMCRFAERVFGVRFDVSSLVGEQRRTVAQVCPDIDFAQPTPDPRTLLEVDLTDPVSGRDALARAFTGEGFDSPQAVGDRLLRHHVTASLLRVAADRPRLWGDAVAAVAQQVPDWGRLLADEPEAVAVALERFVALVSQARGRTSTNEPRPLFSVEVQVWIREVTRLLRAVDKVPRFRWADSPADPESAAIELPSVHCTACGRAGWMALANRAGGQGAAAIERLVHDEPAAVYVTSVRDRERTRVMMRATAAESEALWLDCESGQVYSADEHSARIPVLVGGMTGDDRSETSRDEAAKQQRCPSCGTRDAIRFLGSRVTTLASVGITQMFGSPYVADDERKLLAFTDSVQDASHRAAFFSGRTHRFNLRATMSRALQQRGRLPLTEIADVTFTRADSEPKPADALFSLIPPDLLWETDLNASWRKPGTAAAKDARSALAMRLGFDAILEAGLRSQFGRTLETTNTAIPDILISGPEWERVLAFAKEAVQANTGQLITADDDVRAWIEGLLARLRLRGGIYHSFLDRYVKDHARRWWIWGGGDRLAPKFPRGISAPSFFSSAPSEDFDAIAGSQTWVNHWSRKALGVEGPGADRALRDVLHELVAIGLLEQRESTRGSIWGLPPARIDFVDVRADDVPTEVRCDVCATRHHAPPAHASRWLGRPCLRLRCPGHYIASAPPTTNYYRALYRQGRIRRVVAAEHTGLLTRARRELVETGFKDGGQPDSPNVLASTPTLEMGIDIGDLSAVMLTAVPPTQSNYVQRVGRAGRQTGNAFVTTFAEGDPRSLYFLQDPELMIAGEIAAPNCYLDAIEILRRQYIAFLIDRAAEGPGGALPAAGDMPRTIGEVASKSLQPGGWLRAILDAGASPNWVAQFVRLFGSHLDPAVVARLAQWAGAEMAAHVERVIDRWRAQLTTLTNQRDRLREREAALKDGGALTTEDEQTLGRVVSALRYIASRINSARTQNTLNELEALGLTPNYTLFDDSVTLEVSLWGPNERYDPSDEKSQRFVSEGGEYVRPASRAIRELAPGNWFYVDAHRVRIDAVDNGTEHEPSHTLWRMCTECAWATSDATAEHATCPRCGASGVADQGSLLNVLPLRVVSSTEREITARVGDDNDERDREFHEVRTLVDVDPEDITSAWLHGDPNTIFGVETARAATIRYLNLGLSPGRQPRSIRIAGGDGQVGLFVVCRHCGGVLGIRGDGRDPSDPAHHRTWCKVRSGARKERWESLALVHDLVTEAVRILLPIAEFEYVERLASFKAALLLGLRDSFGGDPSHLRVVVSDFPARGGDPNDRNRFVVLHDTVPGGTGYLPRLADPNELHKILNRARDLITTCECQTRGKPGCHKCLYGGIERHELPRVSRVVALELLDEILADWKLVPAPEGTITGVNLSPVVQSELERMFKVLLQRWADRASARLTSRPDPDHASRTRFDLRFQDGPHWEIREQVNLANHHTIPDFYATRVDTAGTPPVAIYLDGWQYHGQVTTQVDGDARRRASLRADSVRVWTLTWSDVKAALAAADGNGSVSSATPLAGPARNHAGKGIADQLGSDHGLAGVLKLGAFDQLMALLRGPADDDWRRVAMAVALAPISGGVVVDVADAIAAIERVARGALPQPSPVPTDSRAATWETTSGLATHAILDAGANPEHPCIAVVSLDTSNDVSQDQWIDWLHLGNLLAGLGPDAVMTTTASYDATREPVEVRPVEDTAASFVESLLEDCFDQNAKLLGSAAIAAGHTELVVGYEPGWPEGTLMEIAWPDRQVGILPTGETAPRESRGWSLFTAGDTTEAELLAALETTFR